MKNLLVILTKDSDKVCQIMTVVEKKPSVTNFEVVHIKGRRVFKKNHHHLLLAYLAVFSFFNVQAQTQVSVNCREEGRTCPSVLCHWIVAQMIGLMMPQLFFEGCCPYIDFGFQLIPNHRTNYHT